MQIWESKKRRNNEWLITVRGKGGRKKQVECKESILEVYKLLIARCDNQGGLLNTD